mgnify:CR=1 FL=1
MDFGREQEVFPLVLIPVKSAAKGRFWSLKNKREKAFLPFKTQLFHIQAVRYAASGYKIGENFIWGATAMIIAELAQLMTTNTFNHFGTL